jgi:hypothetical protein
MRKRFSRKHKELDLLIIRSPVFPEQELLRFRFWVITPCSLGREYQLHGVTANQTQSEYSPPWNPGSFIGSATCFHDAYFSTLKMETIYISETLVDFQQTTWRYIPEDSPLHNHLCESLKSYMCYVCLLNKKTVIVHLNTQVARPDTSCSVCTSLCHKTTYMLWDITITNMRNIKFAIWLYIHHINWSIWRNLGILIFSRNLLLDFCQKLWQIHRNSHSSQQTLGLNSSTQIWAETQKNTYNS